MGLSRNKWHSLSLQQSVPQVFIFKRLDRGVSVHAMKERTATNRVEMEMVSDVSNSLPPALVEVTC
jgi:hypothetical protein